MVTGNLPLLGIDSFVVEEFGIVDGKDFKFGRR